METVSKTQKIYTFIQFTVDRICQLLPNLPQNIFPFIFETFWFLIYHAYDKIKSTECEFALIYHLIISVPSSVYNSRI